MKRILLAFMLPVFFLTVCYGQKKMKPLSELIDTRESGWDMIMQWKATATNNAEILAKDSLRASNALFQTQLTTASTIGAIVFNCGGILVDDGWIRILGSGCKRLERSLPEWNKGKSFSDYGEDAAYLLVADDALGGFFAVNAGGIDKFDIGQVFYFGPNKLKWVTTGLGYNEFISFCFSGDIQKFYNEFRWTDWKTEVKNLNTDQVISCYPLFWTDAGKDLVKNRKVVPVQTQWNFYQQSQKIFANTNPKKIRSKKK